LDPLLSLKKSGQFDILSANVVDKKSEKPLFLPYVIKRIKANEHSTDLPFTRLTVCIIGLSELNTEYSPANKEPDFTVMDPVETMKIILPQVKDKVDMTILLYYGTSQKLTELINSVSGLDIVLFGGSYSNPVPQNASSAPIFATTTSLGKYLGILKITLSDKKHILSHQAEQVALDENIADDEKMIKLIEEFNKDYEQER
jgi:2',3'-cyclic-nucleotide 2'-phosphodiesterase (5'-nucleotidase family)